MTLDTDMILASGQFEALDVVLKLVDLTSYEKIATCNCPMRSQIVKKLICSNIVTSACPNLFKTI